MAPNTKRVFYVKYLSSPLYAQILGQRPDVQLDRLENDSPDDVATPILGQAHVYQIGASRQVIAPHMQVSDALLARTPNLVAVSSNGAGYDTVDVDACTAQGIAVVNQSGGNREAVADGVTGAIVPVGDVDRMATAFAGLLGDPARLAALGEAGHARWRERFTAEAMVARTESLYREALARRGRAAGGAHATA